MNHENIWQKLENIHPVTHIVEQVSWCVCRGKTQAHLGRTSHLQRVLLHHHQSEGICHQWEQLRTDDETAVYLERPVMEANFKLWQNVYWSIKTTIPNLLNFSHNTSKTSHSKIPATFALNN